MDTSAIQSDAVSTEGGIPFGDSKAPIKVVEFINLRCPHCKTWWDKAAPILDPYVKDGKVQRIIKHYDKDKESLKIGNVLHQYIDFKDSDKARADIDFYYNHLDDWGSLSEEELERYVREEREAEKQDNTIEAQSIIEEVKKANVEFVPTIIIEDYVFDQHIPEEELESVIEAKLDRGKDRESNKF